MFTALSSISINDLQPSAGSGTQSATPGASAPKQTPVPLAQTDTVKLSVTQQVRNLHSEGEGPGQIANSLGLTSSQVNGDLYVSLTWPQLLSKVASSSLTLGSPSSDTPVAGSAAPDSSGATSAASVFPASRASEAAGGATPGTKDASAANLVIFPTARENSAAVAVNDPAARPALAPAGTVGVASKSANAA